MLFIIHQRYERMSLLKISHIEARQIPDSRGEATLETTVVLSDGARGVAAIPQGKSTGSHEAKAVAVPQAISQVPLIFDSLKNDDFDQPGLEKRLLKLDGTADKSHLGANTILAVSVAFAKASSASRGQPLWSYLRQLYNGRLGKEPPKLCMNMINGGLHANNGLRFQEYWAIPKHDSVSDALKTGKEFYQTLATRFSGAPIGDEGGFAPHFADDFEPLQIYKDTAAAMAGDFEFGIDAAASNIQADPDWLYRHYQEMTRQFDISYLEDSFAEEDFERFAKLKAELGPRPILVGDDLTTTNIDRIRLARQHDSINGIIIKPNQIGSLGETLQAIALARDFGWAIIVSHRSGETMDDFIADLAWAVMADGAKFGAPSPPERLVKYERLAKIELTEAAG